MITIDDITKTLNKYNRKYQVMTYRKNRWTNDSCILFYYNNGDITTIGVGDDGKSVYARGRIIGGLKELEDWLYDCVFEEAW